ncbi:MAG: carbohydrate-binding protein [Lachnospiraceae bacterium]|nr:carbohydrate-binding protein [Lachnospiraceae bacterium]
MGFSKHPSYYRWSRHSKQFCALAMAVTVVSTSLFSPVNVSASTSSMKTESTFENPVIYADVPDIDIIRVEDTYYMVSTTMHLSPGCPVMKSTDLVNWEIVNYVYDILGSSDEMALRNGKSMYGNGQWASSIQYHDGTYYVAFNSNTTGKGYIFTTKDIENGSWKKTELKGAYHDMALFFDDDNGKTYLVYGNGATKYIELNEDASGEKEGGAQGTLFNGNGNLFPGGYILNNEGTHVMKQGDYYYVFNICWPNGNPRTEVCHRSKTFPSTDWEVATILNANFSNNGTTAGVAQGGLVDTKDGKWYGFMFQDHGAVGRVPVLTECTWKDGWPMLGKDGDGKTVSQEMELPVAGSAEKSIVKSDEFYNDAAHRVFDADKAPAEEPVIANETTKNITPDLEGEEPPATKTVTETVELVTNGDLETGDTSGWSSTPGEAEVTLEAVEDDSAKSGYVLKASGRKSTGAGPAQDVTGQLEMGKTYTISGRVKYVDGPDTKKINITVQNGANYNWREDLIHIEAKRGEWTEFSYEYTVHDKSEQYKFDNTKNIFFIETPWTQNPTAENDWMDLYVDDFSITTEKEVEVPVETTVELVTNGNLASGDTTGWSSTPGEAEVTLEAIEDDSAESGYVLKASGRKSTGAGPAQDVTGQLEMGKTYTISGKVKYVDGPDTKKINVTVQNGANYNWREDLIHVEAKKGEWTEFSYEYTVHDKSEQYKFDNTKNVFFIETPWTQNPTAENDWMDLYVSDFSITTTQTSGSEEPGKEPEDPAPEKPAGNLIELIENGGGETGEIAPWETMRTEKADVEICDEDPASGNYCIKVTNRKSCGGGASQNLSGKLVLGKTYHVTGKVKYVDGPATKQINVTFENGDNYNWREDLIKINAKKGEWTSFSYDYTVHNKSDQYPFDNTQNYVFFETPWTQNPTEANDYMDLYIDDFSITTESDDMITNGGFEDGIEGWSCNENGDVAVTEEEKYEGEKSIIVTNRAGTGSGPMQDLSNKLTPGNKYSLTAYIMYKEGDVDQKQFNATIQNGPDYNYRTILGSVTAKKGEWTKLTAEYTMPADAITDQNYLFFETPWVPNQTKGNDLMDFYVDSVSLIEHVNTTPKQKEEAGENDYNGSDLDLVWQWNHNPNNNNWSLTDRTGYLRLTTCSPVESLLNARNTLTQRTYGPTCSGKIKLDVSHMENGDVAGLASLSYNYGYVAVKKEAGKNKLVMVNAANNSNKKADAPEEIESVDLNGNTVSLKVDFNFAGGDKANFYYSTDDKTWKKIGNELKLSYELTHFMGSRFAIFNYATKKAGGYVDVDYFRVSDEITGEKEAEEAKAATISAQESVAGIMNTETEVKLCLDELESGSHKSLEASVSIPKLFAVDDVVFNKEAIKGEASYTYKNGRLTLKVTGEDVSFKADDKLFATIKCRVNGYASAAQTAQISADYIKVDGGKLAYEAEPANIKLTYKDFGEIAKKLGYSNPLASQLLGADPYAIVYNGRVYVYMTADDYQYDTNGNVIKNEFDYIHTLRVISSDDMVNWTDHGEIDIAGPTGAAKWAKNSWAPAIAYNKVEGEDRFFVYFANGGSGIGVVEGPTPLGPWTDPIGGALLDQRKPGCAGVVWCFDPAVLVDDDGSAYIYFGGGVPDGQSLNPKTARVAKLGEDMHSIKGEAVMIDAPCMFEDSGIFKKDGVYYYSYCSNFTKANEPGYPDTGTICYMTSDSPMGPFTYQGEVFKNPSVWFNTAGNNHHATFVFNDKTYFIYHAQTVAKAKGEKEKGDEGFYQKGYRSTHIDDIFFNSNGTIKPIKGTYEGIAQLKTVNPYERMEAETIAWNAGIKVTECKEEGKLFKDFNMQVSDIQNGDWISASQADFGDNGSEKITVKAASKNGGSIEVRLNSPEGRLVGTVEVEATGSEDTFKEFSTGLDKVTGVQNIFLVFKGEGEGNLMNVDCYGFTESEADKSALEAGIKAAEAMLSKLSGAEKDALQKAIDTAKVTAQDSKATASQIEAAAEALTLARNTAQKAIDAKQSGSKQPQKPTVSLQSYVGKTFTDPSGLTYKITACSTAKKTVTLVKAEKQLKSIKVPDTTAYANMKFNVTEIGKAAFKGQKKATKAVIGKNITYIGGNAFANCRKLGKVTIKSTSLKAIGKKAFTKVREGITFKVPKKNKKAYDRLLKKAKTKNYKVK